MSESETSVWSSSRGEKLRIDSPDIGDVTVLVAEPREETTLPDGREHAVFVRANGEMAGVNFPQDLDVDDAILVEDADRFQHTLVRHPSGNGTILTRRPPGQPDDWEQRDEFDVEVTSRLEEQ